MVTDVRGPKRYPSDAGVTFEGFEDVRIPSRVEVKKKLDSFMAFSRKSKSPSIRVLLGWWGEGKTDAYGRYIKPEAKKNGDIPLFLSASTLANNYRIEKTQRLFEMTTLSASRFLVAVMNGLNDEHPDLDLEPIESYDDPSSYIEDSLKRILSKSEAKDSRALIFIDEFEELLLDKNLNEIISGLKETINPPQASTPEGGRGRDTIHQEGKFSGRVHFVVACTPDAHYRLQVNTDTSLVFGGLGRREGVLELPRISKNEGVDFLHELIAYCYEGKIPDDGPISDAGVLESLLRAGQSNLGNLVSIMTRLISQAESEAKKGRIRVVDSYFLVDFLRGEQISVYGAQTLCVERETFDRFDRLVKEQKNVRLGEMCSVILHLLLGNQRPLSIDQMSRMTKYNESDIKQAINIINENLRTREGIEGATIRLSKLKDGNADTLLKSEFQQFIRVEGDLDYVKIDEYSELLEDFRDRITHFQSDGTGMTPNTFLPRDHKSAIVFYEGIEQDRATELANLANRICDDETCYVASERLLTQIFPTPVPKALEFLKSRDRRLHIWREVTRNLADLYDASFVEAFVGLAQQEERYDFSFVKQSGRTGSRIYKVVDKDTDSRFVVLVTSVSGDLKSADVEEIAVALGQKPPIHLALIFHTGEVTSKAENKIRDKGLGDDDQVVVMPYKVHQTLAKLFLCFHLAREKYPDEIELEKFNAESKKIISDELGFHRRLNAWMEQKERNGLVLKDIEMSAPNIRDFASSLKFYLNFPDRKLTVKEAFEKNWEGLLRFVFFGSKLSLIPDIESESKLEELSRDLERNGFISAEEDAYEVVRHPTEQRILDVLAREKLCTVDDLESHFVFRAKMRRLLEDVFVSILEYRGLIQKEKRLYTLTDPRNTLYDLETELKQLRDMEKLKKISSYDHVYVVKDRGERLITYQELKNTIGKLEERVKRHRIESRTETMLQTVSLLNRLLRHFLKESRPLMESAAKSGKMIASEISNASKPYLDNLEILNSSCEKWLKVKFTLGRLKEYEKVSQLIKDIKDLHISQTPRDELDSWVSDVKDRKEREMFRFNRDERDAFYFNLKLQRMSKLCKDVTQTISKQEGSVKVCNDLFRQLAEKERKFKKGYEAIKLSKKLGLSFGLLKIIGERGTPGAGIKEISIEDPTLSKLVRIVEGNCKGILSEYEEILSCLEELEQISQIEEVFLTRKSEVSKLVSKGEKLLDLGETEQGLADIIRSLEKVDKDFERMSGKLPVIEKSEDLLQRMKTLRSSLAEEGKELNSIVERMEDIWNSFAQRTTLFLRRIDGVLKAIRKKKDVKGSEKFEKLYEKLSRISQTSFEEVDQKTSVIQNTKDKLRKELYSVVRGILSGNELNILEIVVQLLEDSDERWARMALVYENARSVHKMKKDVVDKSLRKLLEDGFLQAGISFKA